MLDLIIRNGEVIDGSGSPRRRSDIGILHGRIVTIGEVSEDAARVIDATSRIVAPGFIDIHTHYDAQVFWDPALTPSPFHGVTTVVLGNCGLTLAPIAEQTMEYTLRLLGRVEGMPTESLEEGVPWGMWHSFAEYLDAFENDLVINAAALVGHNALRLTVMGLDMRREATPSEIAAMVARLEESLANGGVGFSTSITGFHNDAEGGAIPSRYASEAEILALCLALRRHPGTVLQITGGLTPFKESEMALMTAMSLTADRPINWNSLMVSSAMLPATEHNLSASDYAAERGASVFALAFAIAPTTRLNFLSGMVLDTIPGWAPIFQERDLSRRAEMLANLDVRNVLAASARQVDSLAAYTCWESHTIGETFSATNDGLVGRRIGDIAIERGQDAFACMLDIVLADELRTVLVTLPNGNDEESWKLRSEIFQNPRVLIGASDAGAHLDMIDTFAYTTDILGPSVRDRRLFTLEEAVRLITEVPARVYGLSDRGKVDIGYHADLVVFDPDRIGQGPVHLRDDLPGGASRLYMVATGIDRVLVSGEEVVRGIELTGETPGRVLRSGRDTTTVHADFLPKNLKSRTGSLEQ